MALAFAYFNLKLLFLNFNMFTLLYLVYMVIQSYENVEILLKMLWTLVALLILD